LDGGLPNVRDPSRDRVDEEGIHVISNRTGTPRSNS
jgi:hypothetical protein